MNKILLTLILLFGFILVIGLGNRLLSAKSETAEETPVVLETITPVPSQSPEPTLTPEATVTTEPEVTPSPITTKEPEMTSKPVITEEPKKEETPQENTDYSVFSDVDSILILANKTHPLPEGYEPSDLTSMNVKVNKSGLTLRKEAAAAIEEMFEAAKNDGITLVLGSSYRSYSYQAKLYNNYVARDGEEKASKYSAKPGQSEHQTGLAADISDASGATYLSQKFKNTEEGIWLKDNAHKYGFILRYPEGKEDITGYMFEPWHFRYVGIDYATKIYEANTTFEEYFNILD